MNAYKFNSLPPPIDKLNKVEKQSVLQKYTRANLKLTINLDIPQLIDLVEHLFYCTLS